MGDQHVRDVMTPQVVALPTTSTLTEAAQRMRDADVGDVLVVDDGILRGVLTDRDIVIRCLAEGANVTVTTVGDVCSSDPAVVHHDTSVGEAVKILRQVAVRRLPVVDEIGRPVGVVTIGDLAVEQDSRSALADISAAPPNR